MDREQQLSHIYGEVSSGRALSRVLREDEGLPSKSEFWRWHAADENIRDNLARARLHGVEAIMDETLDISDTQMIGEMVTTKADGSVETRREDMLGHRKLMVETRIKYAQMIAPRKYGPKMDVTSGGEAVKGVTVAFVKTDAASEG